MVELNVGERKLIALALFSFGMRQQPKLRGDMLKEVTKVARKLGADGELREYSRDWIEYAKKGGVEP